MITASDLPWTWWNAAEACFEKIAIIGLEEFFIDQFGITKWDLFLEMDKHNSIWMGGNQLYSLLARFLLAKQLVTYHYESRIYSITRRGIRFLRLYDKMTGMLDKPT